MARDMKKVCSGTRRDEGIKWFTQLSDKGKEMFLVQDRSVRLSLQTTLFLCRCSKSHQNSLLLGHEEQ